MFHIRTIILIFECAQLSSFLPCMSGEVPVWCSECFYFQECWWSSTVKLKNLQHERKAFRLLINHRHHLPDMSLTVLDLSCYTTSDTEKTKSKKVALQSSSVTSVALLIHNHQLSPSLSLASLLLASIMCPSCNSSSGTSEEKKLHHTFNLTIFFNK